MKRCLAAAGLLFVLSAAVAQPLPRAGDYPSQPIRIVSPFPPGGGNDAHSRLIGQKLAELAGVQVLIDNRGGAGGNLGASEAAKSKADGYTLFTGQTSIMAVNPVLYASVPFDPRRDFVPITQINAAPLVIVAAASSPHRTLQEFFATARRSPGKLTYATPGNGTLSHIAGETLERAAQADVTHIPYKGASTATTELLGGQIDAFVTSTSSVAQFVQQGRMRPLAVTSNRRVGVFASAPTLEESGFPGMVYDDWYGLFAPAGTPRDRLAWLQAALARVFAAEDLRKKILDGGSEVVGNSPEVFAEVVKADMARWAKAVKDSGARID